MGSKDTLARRFWSKVDRGGRDDCWPWTGATLPAGYGFLTRFVMVDSVRRRKTVYAHRISYELHCGEIPKDIFILHTCDNPGCVNPAHLMTGTHQDNMDDMANKGRHPYFLPRFDAKKVGAYFAAKRKAATARG